MIAGSLPGYLAEVRDCGSGDAQANARLIAAAPELLGELIKITDAYAEAMKDAGVTHYPEALVVVRHARAAIAKARGE